MHDEPGSERDRYAHSPSHRSDFPLLWFGTTVSLFGARVGLIALPLVAVQTLGATPLEMGLLTAAQTIGVVLVGLPAGAVVDRVRRLRLMVTVELLRASALLTLPVAAAANLLGLTHLLVVAVLIGVVTVFFDLAQQAYLPVLVGRSRLVESNAKLQASQSVAGVSGPSIGGAAMGLVGGATTVLATGLLFLVSAAALRRIRADPEAAATAGSDTTRPTPTTSPGRRSRSLRTEVAEGLRLVLGDRVLRAIACCTGTTNLFMSMVIALAVLYLARDLALPSWATGLVLAASGAGGVAAALTARRWAARFGQARAIWLAMALTQPCGFLLPLSGRGWGAALFAVGWLGLGYGGTVYNIIQVSLRQRMLPDRLLGRASAANRILAWGTLPLGAIAGGLLATTTGVRPALWVVAFGLCASVLWLVCSPLFSQPPFDERPQRKLAT